MKTILKTISGSGEYTETLSVILEDYMIDEIRDILLTSRQDSNEHGTNFCGTREEEEFPPGHTQIEYHATDLGVKCVGTACQIPLHDCTPWAGTRKLVADFHSHPHLEHKMPLEWFGGPSWGDAYVALWLARFRHSLHTRCTAAVDKNEISKLNCLVVIKLPTAEEMVALEKKWGGNKNRPYKESPDLHRFFSPVQETIV